MSKNIEFEAMADLCIETGTLVMETGSDDLRIAMRLVLSVLARDLVRYQRGATSPIRVAAIRRGRTEGKG